MAANDRIIELYVDGLTCGHCVASVTEELSEIPSVKAVDVQLEKGATSKVTVTSETVISEDALRDAIAEAGYELKEIQGELAS